VWGAYEVRDPLWLQSFQLRNDGHFAEAAQAAALAHAATPWLGDYARPAGLPLEASLAQKALAAIPLDGNPSRQFDRALLLIQVAQFQEAEALLRNLAARGERFDRGFLMSSEPLFYLGRIAARRGNRQAAAELFERAAARNPGDPFVLAQLAALTANPTYAFTIARYYSAADALFLVGAAQLEHGTHDHGVTSLNELLQRMPELWHARILLSAALGAAGDLDGAVREYRKAMAVRSEPAMMEEHIVPVFAAVAERGRNDARAQFDYALVLEQFGRFGEALSALRAAEASGGGAEVARALERVTLLVERDSDPR
jgi:tetratricopeptide (TPR) repeat protein